MASTLASFLCLSWLSWGLRTTLVSHECTKARRQTLLDPFGLEIFHHVAFYVSHELPLQSIAPKLHLGSTNYRIRYWQLRSSEVTVSSSIKSNAFVSRCSIGSQILPSLYSCMSSRNRECSAHFVKLFLLLSNRGLPLIHRNLKLSVIGIQPSHDL